MHTHPNRRNMPSLVLLLCLALSFTGCASFEARRTFNRAALGQPWSEVKGAGAYGKNCQLAFHQSWGPGMGGADYLVVLTDRGTVAAKAYLLAGSPTSFGLQTRAEYWAELKEVASHYPYYAPPPGGAGLFIPLYPYVAHPLSEDDKILPSGVRQSTWALLMRAIDGWPFDLKYKNRVDEAKVYWDRTVRPWPEVAKSPDQLPTEGTITVFWNKGPLSR